MTISAEQVNVKRGVDAARVLMETAQEAGLPYYKVTFLSLATASHQVCHLTRFDFHELFLYIQLKVYR